MRRANAWSVLEAIRKGGVVSRADIGERTGLTAMSVHRRVAELRRRRLVVPAGSSPAGGIGRPSSLFRFNGAIGHVVGLDVGNETTRGMLVGLDRQPRAELELPTSMIEGDLATHLLGLIRQLQAEAKVKSDALMGIAVGIAGVTRSDGTIVRASQHRRWDGLDLGARLRDALGIDVEIRQDDHFAALAELHRGAVVGLRTALLVNVGKGIGLGIITDGAVHAGAHGAAGRATWIPLRPDDPGATGPLAGDLITGDGIVADYIRVGGQGQPDGARAVFAADAAGDTNARLAIDLFAARLGWLIGTAVAITDPEIVVIGGGVGRALGRLRGQVTSRVAEIIPAPPPIVASTLGPGAVAAGAIDAALALADVLLHERLAG
jgi:predicted NBD/HSP70 family sugar kinase